MPEINELPARPGSVYFNGRMVASSEAGLPLDDAGLLYGLGFFETFRTRGGRPHHWRYHVQRLTRACETAGVTVSADFLALQETRLREVVRRMLAENDLEDAVFRYTVTAGRATPGGTTSFQRPAEFLTLRPLPPSPGEQGVVLRVLKLRRDSGEWLPRPKSLNYANALLGTQELKQRGAAPEDEGLFLGRDHRCVVETPRQNVAWIADGRLCIPDPDLGAVAGTCLHWVQEILPGIVSRRDGLEALLAADAIIVLNAVRGITPVRELWDEEDSHRRGFDSHVHPLVTELRQRWRDALQVTASS